MTDPRAILAELDGLRMERAALVERIARLGRYSSLRNELCVKVARITRRVLELETSLPRTELAPADPEADAGEATPPEAMPPVQGELYGGQQPYWVRN